MKKRSDTESLYFNEYCESTTQVDENDRRALFLWHKIQRAIDIPAAKLDKFPPKYTISNGFIYVKHIHKK